MLNRLLTTTDVAGYLQVDPNTVYCCAGESRKIGAIKVGHEWQIGQQTWLNILASTATAVQAQSTSLRDIFLRRQLRGTPKDIDGNAHRPRESVEFGDRIC